jgi:aspartyl-tRNA(Asn)/glutamyl-tRNA(Gln) amidotransferase subunit B
MTEAAASEAASGPGRAYEAVIGLEIHAQLATRSKAFSPDSAAFGGEPNTHVDAVSLGHPGTLPVLNGRMVEFAVRAGLATNCRIARRSVFARKHYFYPDLPKGYQISQYDAPICEHGWLDVDVPAGAPGGSGVRRRIGITRIHMEEDAGKSMHDQDPLASLVDYNRCGVPLVEIVTEPDIRSPAEAGAFLREIRQIVRYLGICDGNMEEGSLRCDANVSVRPAGVTGLGTKTEVKNLNSIRNVERAIAHEVERQVAVIEAGGRIVQESRLWDAAAGSTRSMRSKEEAHDYRYFPDPDLPPVVVDEARLAALRADLPELPHERRQRFVGELGLPAYDAGVLTEDRAVADYFEVALAALASGAPTPEDAKAVSNFVMGDVQRVLNERAIDIAGFPVEAARLAALVGMRQRGELSSSAATALFDAMLERPEAPEVLAGEMGLLQVSDAGALEPVVDAVIAANPKQVEQYRAGKTTVIGFFVGQVMRAFPGSPDPKVVREMLERSLAE